MKGLCNATTLDPEKYMYIHMPGVPLQPRPPYKCRRLTLQHVQGNINGAKPSHSIFLLKLLFWTDTVDELSRNRIREQKIAVKGFYAIDIAVDMLEDKQDCSNCLHQTKTMAFSVVTLVL